MTAMHELIPYQDSLPPAKPTTYDLRGEGLEDCCRTVELQVVDKVRYSKQFGPTKGWGYDGMIPGPTFIVDNTQTVHLGWRNSIPEKAKLPYPAVVFADPPSPDLTASPPPTLADIGNAIPQNQAGSKGGFLNEQAAKLSASTVTHLHGGLTPADSDGWTENVMPADRTQPATYGKNGLPDGEEQRGCLLWYHDHAIGVTRLNVYAGLFGFWVIRDKVEKELIKKGLIPGEDDELFLLIQDRNFETDDGSTDGDLTGALLHKTETSTAEMFGPCTLVNGKLWPTCSVPARPVRVRILNGSNSRTYCLRLVEVTATTTDGQPVYGADHTVDPGLWWQIGSDGGLLRTPVVPGSFGPDLSNPANPPINRGLVLAPAERADLVIDFSKLANTKVAFVNTAFAPFHGSTVTYPNKYDPGGSIIGEADPTKVADPKNTMPPGQVGDSSPAFRLRFPHVIQFEVGKNGKAKPSPLTEKTVLDAKMVRYVHEKLPPDHKHRWIALTENPTGNLQLRELEAYTTDPDVAAAWPPGAPLIPIRTLNGVVTWYQTVAKNFHDPVSFFIPVGSCEVWNILNLTVDTHPIHVHLVQFQVLTRQPYVTSGIATPSPTNNPGNPATAADVPAEPDLNEQGFKDTVRVNPGELVSIAAYFKGYCGKYMYHCHILEHEDHDMMRPFVVVVPDAFAMMAGDMGGPMKM